MTRERDIVGRTMMAMRWIMILEYSHVNSSRLIVDSADQFRH